MHAKISRLIYSYRFQSSRFPPSNSTPDIRQRRSKDCARVLIEFPTVCSQSSGQGKCLHGNAFEKGCAILSPTLELAKAPQIYICLIQGSEEIITKAFYSIADHPEFDLFVDAFYLCLSFNNCFLK